MQNRNTYEFIQSLQRNGYENITVADPSIGLSYKMHVLDYSQKYKCSVWSRLDLSPFSSNINQKELEAANIKFVSDSKGLGTEADVLFTGMFSHFGALAKNSLCTRTRLNLLNLKLWSLNWYFSLTKTRTCSLRHGGEYAHERTKKWHGLDRPQSSTKCP